MSRTENWLEAEVKQQGTFGRIVTTVSALKYVVLLLFILLPFFDIVTLIVGTAMLGLGIFNSVVLRRIVAGIIVVPAIAYGYARYRDLGRWRPVEVKVSPDSKTLTFRAKSDFRVVEPRRVQMLGENLVAVSKLTTHLIFRFEKHEDALRIYDEIRAFK